MSVDNVGDRQKISLDLSKKLLKDVDTAGFIGSQDKEKNRQLNDVKSVVYKGTLYTFRVSHVVDAKSGQPLFFWSFVAAIPNVENFTDKED